MAQRLHPSQQIQCSNKRNRLIVWVRPDIRRIPTLVKEVDKVIGSSRQASNPAKKILYQQFTERVAELEEFKMAHFGDPRLVVLDDLILKLHYFAQSELLPNDAATFANSNIKESEQQTREVCTKNDSNVPVPPSTEKLLPTAKEPEKNEESTKSKRLYKWEHLKSDGIELVTKDGTPLFPLSEPGHYAVKDEDSIQNENNDNLDFQIIMSEEDWRSIKFQERKLVAEAKYCERQQQIRDAKPALETKMSMAASIPYVDPERITTSIYRKS